MLSAEVLPNRLNVKQALLSSGHTWTAKSLGTLFSAPLILITFWENSADGESTHYENMPIQIYGKFHLQKLKIFR